MSAAQGQDGSAFLSYYNKEHELSFVWDGSRGQLVDVSVGGYGEPVKAWFAMSADLVAVRPLGTALIMFAAECRDFVDAFYKRGE